jgi:hypothetical protein
VSRSPETARAPRRWAEEHRKDRQSTLIRAFEEARKLPFGDESGGQEGLRHEQHRGACFIERGIDLRRPVVAALQPSVGPGVETPLAFERRKELPQLFELIRILMAVADEDLRPGQETLPAR